MTHPLLRAVRHAGDGRTGPVLMGPVLMGPALTGLVLTALVLAGCSGGSAPVASGATPSAGRSAGTTTGTPVPFAGSSAPACPPPPPSTLVWPQGVPADLPVPPGAGAGSVAVESGLTVVRFSTGDSLRSGVLHLVRSLQPAGFTLGRGDAEAGEADAPFTRDDLRGVYRLVVRTPCTTDWLVAVSATPGGAPLLPAPSGSPSPLPFG